MPEPPVDLQTASIFDQLADNRWNPNGPMKPLHAINPARLAFIQAQLMETEPLSAQRVSLLAARSVLDVGCGGGILSEALARQGAVVTGCDLSAPLIQTAQTHAQQQGLAIQYLRADAACLRTQLLGPFSIICCMELLEHVSDPEALIHNCSQLAAPGGHLFFSTLNRTPQAWLTAIVGAEYLLSWLPRGTHRFEAFIRPSELATAARKQGLTVRAIRGIQYHILAGAWQLSAKPEVNYLMHCQKAKASDTA